jgi:DNA-binding LacI/PurR family transcriptional regulator
MKDAIVRDVARKAGVSAMTVSRVMNGGTGAWPFPPTSRWCASMTSSISPFTVHAPFLTVIDQPTEMFGPLAAQLVLERIGAERGGPPRAVILQAELLVRQSCGAKLSGGGRRRTISP